MNRIIIIGGGFAGVSVVTQFSQYRRDWDITLLDRKKTFDFSPLLPDVIGRNITYDFVSYPLDELCRSCGYAFLNEEVTSVDLGERKVTTSQSILDYDYLIIASGAQSNFYGNAAAAQHSLTMDSLEDTKDIFGALKLREYETCVVVGGGYTGLEIATNLWRFFKRHGMKKKIVIAERAPYILSSLPEWMREYALRNLRQLDIQVFCDTVAEVIKKDEVELSNGLLAKPALLIWTAGVKTGDFIDNLKAEKIGQGRVRVDEFLRLNERCFVIGDAAGVMVEGASLRMAVQFALAQGRLAAINVFNCIEHQPFKPYYPQDLGYIVPMANNWACGKACGVNVRGKIAMALHYFFCFLRSYGPRNKWGVLHDLVSKRRKGGEE